MPKPLLILVLLTFLCAHTFAQVESIPKKTRDSIIAELQQIPASYINAVDKKITKYTGRINSKTIKTLTKLSRWETKIQQALTKVNPDAATKLFGNNQLTFTSLLHKLQAGEATMLTYRNQYDTYRDGLTTKMKYLSNQKVFLDSGIIRISNATTKKMDELNAEEDSTQAIAQFIKERKKELVKEAMKHIGNSKYLSKMNREVFYYGETLRNYKELFNDEEKTEQAVKGLLNKIPGFQQFVQKNSMLAGMFAPAGDASNSANLAGLQTRAGVQNMIQDRIRSGGPNAQQLFNQQIEAAKSQLNEFKDKLLKSPSGSGEMPDFAPNMQKTKTLAQRLEYGSNFQFGKSGSFMPSTMDVALTVGYKLNDKSVAGIGASYKLGMGSIDRIRLSTQGISLRSFMDWKLKKQFFISGGWEMNYLTNLTTGIVGVPYGNGWQQAALMGISKKLKVKTKWFKETKVQLLYDFLAKQHLPVSQPVVFRIGYNF